MTEHGDPDAQSTAGSMPLTEDEINDTVTSFFNRPVEAIWGADHPPTQDCLTVLTAEEVRVSLAAVIAEAAGSGAEDRGVEHSIRRHAIEQRIRSGEQPSDVLSQPRLPAKEREIEFILRLQFRQVVSQRNAMGSDSASACDTGLLD